MHNRVTARDGVAMAAVFVLFAVPMAAAAGTLAPKDIQTTFFDGKVFSATTPSGVTFRMVFEADGKVRREPTAKTGAKGEGTWALGADGFCTTWKGAKANCFTVVPAGPNTWSVMKGPTLKATWSK